MTEGRLFTPADYIPQNNNVRVVFLAGPIQGAEDWQCRAADYLLTNNDQIVIANPRRNYLPGDYDKTTQVNWELDHLERARNSGVCLFWLGREIEHDPTRAFAQTTRVELGLTVGISTNKSSKMAIGVEDGFSGAWYIQHLLSRYQPDVIVRHNLIDTCNDVLRLVK